MANSALNRASSATAASRSTSNTWSRTASSWSRSWSTYQSREARSTVPSRGAHAASIPPRETSAILPSSATLERVTTLASRPRVATTATTSSTTRPPDGASDGPAARGARMAARMAHFVTGRF